MPICNSGLSRHTSMRIVVAPDSFKESLSALEAARAIAEGIRRACPDAEVVELPMADGGEGTVEALVQATGGRIVACIVTGPLGAPIDAFYGVLGDGETAVVETAAASGLQCIPREQRDPRITTTRGTGELIRHAMSAGARKLIVGLGGSGTNDLGAGMAQALGYQLLDARGDALAAGGGALARLHRIVAPDDRPWERVEVRVACDVDNPLTGPRGASHVYGPQKGASPEDVDALDAALAHAASIIARDLGVSIEALPGAGAAGGLGGGVVAFLGARLERGAALMAEACGLEQSIADADLVFTAEGRLDSQSLHGKTPVGVAAVSQRHGVPCIALAGALGEGYQGAYAHGITAVFSISHGPATLDQALHHAREHLASTAEAVMRVWSHAAGENS